MSTFAPQSPTSHLRHRTSSSIPQSLIDPLPNEQTAKTLKRSTSSIQSIFWSGIAIFTIIVLMMIYYTTYYLPSSTHHETFLFDNIDDNDTAPFGFGSYPYDVPYELRDISKYSKIVAIGDLHGDLSQTLKVLQLSGIIDENGTWIAIDTILVQTGDIVDRGHESIEIYKLFFALRQQAALHNSLVLQILGNHELMNIKGDFRYVQANEVHKYGTIAQWRDIWSIDRKIGYFIRHTPIMRVVGNTLFVHAGLRPEIINIVKESNATNELNELMLKAHTFEVFDPEHVMNEYYDFVTVSGNNGPLWTREFEPRFYSQKMFNAAQKQQNNVGEIIADNKLDTIEKYLCEQVEKTLRVLKVKRMIIGHNVQHTKVPTARCNNKLFSIDVGISCAYGCGLGAVAIDIESDIVSIITP